MKPHQFEQAVLKTIKSYNLISPKDKVLVACSGGKDSTSVLYLLKKFGYSVEAITIDVAIGSYTKQNLQNIREVCKKLGIRLHEVSLRKKLGCSICYMRSVLKSKGVAMKSCSICGIVKRYLLNQEARRLKANKLVTGHNLDDEAQSILMNFLRGNLMLLSRLGPVTGIIQDEKFVTRIKPLYFCAEKDVFEYSKTLGLPINYAPCPCRADAYRKEVLDLLNAYEKRHSGIKQQIVGSFLQMLPKLKRHYTTTESLAHCELCGEPSRRRICSTCGLLVKIK